MRNKLKLVILSIILFALLILLPNFSSATTPITDEETLLNAISSADSGDTITLQSNITVTKPIVIQKELIINGNGYTVAGSTEWTSTTGNQTMFTAQLSDAKLTLVNINLNNGPKYGVQSYDGATVILDNVSITGFRYGGVLVNGGKVEVKDLRLGYNGTGSNNGIEIDKGSAATNNPVLVMNGKLSSDSNENIIRVASNGKLTEFTITNTPNTTNKVSLAGNKLLLTDANNNIIAETSVPEAITANADEEKAIITLISNNKTNRITVDLGKTITADLLKSHITLEENYTIDGFFTDDKYTTAFDFSKPINSDTIIYTKISKVETIVPEPEIDEEEKDETPQTGVQNYLGISIISIAFSIFTIAFINRKQVKQ